VLVGIEVGSAIGARGGNDLGCQWAAALNAEKTIMRLSVATQAPCPRAFLTGFVLVCCERKAQTASRLGLARRL
jgi:hypothetical protein